MSPRYTRLPSTLPWTLWISTLYGSLVSSAPTTTFLDRRNEDTPSPISVPANQFWDGIDGQWSTFMLRVGDPATFVRVLPSTNNQETLVVDPRNCDGDTPFPDRDACLNDRGLAFDIETSSSWKEIGFYDLELEKDLNYTGEATFGLDVVSLGTDGPPLVTVNNSTVGVIKSQDYWVGSFGLHWKATHFQSLDDSYPSYMALLRQENLIPSMSFGYTAGAQYRFTKILGSLTLGGFDQSKIVPNDVTFQLAPDNSRDLVVAIQQIEYNSNSDLSELKSATLSSDSYFALIDSSVAEIWLPAILCFEFEKAFGIAYDNATGLYLVNDILHTQLISINATVTFTLAPEFNGGSTVQIVLPYAAFDLTAEPPYRGLKRNTKFFPLRRMNDPNKLVLGRTFLQEAYITVDYERSNFSVSQVHWEPTEPSNIIAIEPPPNSNRNLLFTPSPSSDSTAADGGSRIDTPIFIGIGIGVAGAIVIMLIGAWIFWRRWKGRQMEKLIAKAKAESRKESPSNRSSSSSDIAILSTTKIIPKAELSAESSSVRSLTSKSELSADRVIEPPDTPSTPVETEGLSNQIYEMLGSVPERTEADSRQFTEKEAIVHRERIYNGTDPTPSPALSSPATPNFSRRPPINGSDVNPIFGTTRSLLPSRSPSTPVSPLRSDLLRPSVDGSSTRSRNDVHPLSRSETVAVDSRRRKFSFEEQTDDERTR